MFDTVFYMVLADMITDLQDDLRWPGQTWNMVFEDDDVDIATREDAYYYIYQMLLDSHENFNWVKDMAECYIDDGDGNDPVAVLARDIVKIVA